MANRYWRGGTATWDATAGSKWAATAGGSTGASVPTAADDVFFDATSSGTCTIATGRVAKSINCTGFTGTLTGTGTLTVSGSITLVAGMTYTHTGAVTINATGTLTTAGKEFSGVTVSGSGITVTLGDALNTGTRSVVVTQGTFNTANYNVTASVLSSSNANTRTITLGSSTVTLSAVGFETATNLTFNANTSQINITDPSPTFNGGGQTFYNVSFTSTSAGTRGIQGANTFNNLTLTASATGVSQFTFNADQTVNGTFTCAGLSATQRGFVRSNNFNTPCTITAAAVSANDCDFRDITIAGAAAPISPTRGGDCGGNSGITFPAAKTVYRVGTDTTWEGSSSWALASGGAGSNDNFPLAQDTAIINEDTTLTGTLSLNVTYNIGALDCSTRTTGITLNHNHPVSFYGSYTLGSGITVSGTSGQTFSGRGTMVFTSAGKTITFPITVFTPSGTFELGDAYSSSGSVAFTRGTFDAKNYNVTCTTFSSTNANPRTLTMGSGLWTLSGTGNVWVTGITTNLTFNKDTADILLSNTTTTARTFSGGGLTFNKLTIGGAAGTSTTSFSGVNTFSELASTKTVAHTIRLTLAANGMTVGVWSVTGTAGNVVTVDSSTAGTQRNFNLTNVTNDIDYLSVTDIAVNQADRFYVGANSTDGGNNSNVIFTAAPSINVYVTGVPADATVGTAVASLPKQVLATGVEAQGAVGTVTTQSAYYLTGVSATGAVGTVNATGKATTTLTGVEATGSVGTVIAGSFTFVSVTGVSATGSVGTVNATGEVNTTLTGVEATGAVGTVNATGKATTTLTGVEATGAVGTANATGLANVRPIGVQGSGAVGTVLTSGAAQTTLTGVEATGSVGAVAVSLPRQVSVTGVEATGSVGTANATGLANVRPIGVQGSGAVGTPSFSLSGKFPVTGVEATGSVGTAAVSLPKQVSVTGLFAANDVGTVAVESEGRVSLTGVSATGAIGDTQEKSAANVAVTGVSASVQLDSVVVRFPRVVQVTGVSAAGQVGTVTLVAGCKVFATGVQAAVVVTTPLVWGVINDNQTPNWTPVNDAQADSWTQVNDGNTVIWTQIPT